MLIAQISPLYESVPPKLYGGTERIVYNLSESLIAMGHDVVVFASQDSKTSAELVSTGHDALRLKGYENALLPHYLLFEKLRKMQSDFDIVHFHTELIHFPIARSLKVPTVTTLHGRQDLPDYREMYAEYCDLPLVSISMTQRKPVLSANWVGMVHHGLDSSHLQYHERSEGYLAFLGRLSPEKGVHIAIELARQTGRRIKIAAKAEPEHYPEYWEEIQPLLKEPFVEYVGEIGDDNKSEFLGNADALIFPILWPEPFGLVMIEALATGTPVIAFRNGSVPEIIKPGFTGFIVDNLAEACGAVESLHMISRKNCLHEFQSRFTQERMAENYVAIYERICGQHRRVRSVPRKAVSDLPGGPD